MPTHKRTTHLLPAGIVVLGTTIAMFVAMVGTAAAAAVSSVDTGSQNFHGERDSGSATRESAALTMSTPKITEALQPGQTVSSVTTGGGSIGDPMPRASALGPTSAPQPGQTGW